jgi:hypothetical protein
MDPVYRSALNRGVAPAAPGEFHAIPIGPLSVWPPVVLAPMAGVTNPPFRTLCRRYGAGLYVSEMITARALVEGNRKTLLMASFGKDETTRSLQLYGVDPYHVGEAVKLLVDEDRVDHLDMNFGCPVRKVTSKGGGSAIPLKPRLLRSIVAAAVRHAGRVPVTLKFRVGIDDRYETFLDSGRIGQEEGCAAVGLHARTAAQLYDGEARWDAIARLKQAVTRIPVLVEHRAEPRRNLHAGDQHQARRLAGQRVPLPRAALPRQRQPRVDAPRPADRPRPLVAGLAARRRPGARHLAVGARAARVRRRLLEGLPPRPAQPDAAPAAVGAAGEPPLGRLDDLRARDALAGAAERREPDRPA